MRLRRSGHRPPSDERRLRRRWLHQTVLGVVTLALTPLPIFFYMSNTADGYMMYLKGLYSLFPPSTPDLPGDQLRVALADRSHPTYGVPVLVYHGIGNTTTDTSDLRFVVSRERFAQQMRALQAAGYHAITTAQLAAYLRGADPRLLPPKPILITLDGGREDAMLQADPILRDTGMKATMFVTGADAGSSSFYYADWNQLGNSARNGRWELANHTDSLHHISVVDGRPQSDLVELLPGESVAAYKRRIGADLDRAESLIDQHSSDHPIAFSYPYGDWGQSAGPRIADALDEVLRSRFQLAFDQDGQSGWRPAMPGDDRMRLHRLQAMDWTGAQLIERLQAAMKLGRTTFEERGLNFSYTTNQLVAAAAAYSCPSGGPVTAAAGPTTAKAIALTFDGGPSPYTAQMLDVLAEYHDRATFFVQGDQLGAKSRLLARMIIAGDEIGDGTWSGRRLDTTSASTVRASLVRAQAAIRAAVPITPCFARPPFGLDRDRFAGIASWLGLGTALWSVDPRDFRSTDPETIAHRVAAEVSPGAIVVLHDGGRQRWATVQALPLILDRLHQMDYRLVTVSELLAQP